MKGYVENLIAGYQDMVRRRDYLKHELTVLKNRQVTEEDIRAKFENGVLTLNIPKKEPEKKVEEKKLIAIEG